MTKEVNGQTSKDVKEIESGRSNIVVSDYVAAQKPNTSGQTDVNEPSPPFEDDVSTFACDFEQEYDVFENRFSDKDRLFDMLALWAALDQYMIDFTEISKTLTKKSKEKKVLEAEKCELGDEEYNYLHRMTAVRGYHIFGKSGDSLYTNILKKLDLFEKECCKTKPDRYELHILHSEMVKLKSCPRLSLRARLFSELVSILKHKGVKSEDLPNQEKLTPVGYQHLERIWIVLESFVYHDHEVMVSALKGKHLRNSVPCNLRNTRKAHSTSLNTKQTSRNEVSSSQPETKDKIVLDVTKAKKYRVIRIDDFTHTMITVLFYVYIAMNMLYILSSIVAYKESRLSMAGMMSFIAVELSFTAYLCSLYARYNQNCEEHYVIESKDSIVSYTPSTDLLGVNHSSQRQESAIESCC